MFFALLCALITFMQQFYPYLLKFNRKYWGCEAGLLSTSLVNSHMLRLSNHMKNGGLWSVHMILWSHIDDHWYIFAHIFVNFCHPAICSHAYYQLYLSEDELRNELFFLLRCILVNRKHFFEAVWISSIQFNVVR